MSYTAAETERERAAVRKALLDAIEYIEEKERHGEIPPAADLASRYERLFLSPSSSWRATARLESNTSASAGRSDGPETLEAKRHR